MFMWYVLLSVFCSVTVAIILKLAKNRGHKPLHLIFLNYLVAATLTYFVLRPDSYTGAIGNLPWHLYVPLGVLLPLIFLCIAFSIAYSGIVRTEIAQRLSLFIPLLAAFFIFHEAMAPTKLVGIGVGLCAILCAIGWHKGGKQSNHNWIYPVCVFIGMGVIDIFFKKVALFQGVPYSFSMFLIFVLAGIITLAILLFRLFTGRDRLELKALGWGILLGLFNFGNILFYMKAHRALPESPSIVFTGMNIGVILLGALVGVTIFHERLSLLNKVGLGLAVISVLIIAFL